MKKRVEQASLAQVAHEQVEVELNEQEQAGKRQAYIKYKESGIEWLGKIPDRWSARKLKYLTRLKYGNALPSEQREQGNVLVFGSNGPVGTHSQANTLSPVIIIGRKGSFGKIAYLEEQCFAIDTTYYIDVVQNEVNIRWLFYALNLLNLDDFTEDSAIPGLSRVYVYTQWLPFPSLLEQARISSFLDRETTRINTLIAKKEQHIALLQERRTAIINQAVTKGLNTNTPMKDSGVKWLREIPEHWDIRKLKYDAKFFSGGTPSKANADYWSGDIPWVSPKDMKSERLLDTEDHISQEALKESATHLITPEAVLIVVRSGILKHSIPIAINQVPVTINQDIKAIKLDRNILPKYLAALFNSHQSALLVEWRKAGATVESIEYDLLINTRILMPPLEEQLSIVTYLEQETTKIDRLITGIQESIKKLKEYSTALVSAAVTGKIDVRGEVAVGSVEDAII
jgi:type I restriction enzyme S subunit